MGLACAAVLAMGMVPGMAFAVAGGGELGTTVIETSPFGDADITVQVGSSKTVPTQRFKVLYDDDFDGTPETEYDATLVDAVVTNANESASVSVENGNLVVNGQVATGEGGYMPQFTIDFNIDDFKNADGSPILYSGTVAGPTIYVTKDAPIPDSDSAPDADDGSQGSDDSDSGYTDHSGSSGDSSQVATGAEDVAAQKSDSTVSPKTGYTVVEEIGFYGAPYIIGAMLSVAVIAVILLLARRGSRKLD